MSTKLPPHSGAAVAATLQQWGDWTGQVPANVDMTDVRGALTRQGAVWPALLTGEKDARQMLDPSAFVAAAVRLARVLRKIIAGLLRTYAPVVAVVLLAALLVLYVIPAGDVKKRKRQLEELERDLLTNIQAHQASRRRLAEFVMATKRLRLSLEAVEGTKRQQLIADAPDDSRISRAYLALAVGALPAVTR